MGSASGLTTEVEGESSNQDPHCKEPSRDSVGIEGVGKWSAGPSAALGGAPRLAGGAVSPAFAWRMQGDSGIYAAACVIPKARRISRPLFSAGTSLFFKSMVTHF